MIARRRRRLAQLVRFRPRNSPALPAHCGKGPEGRSLSMPTAARRPILAALASTTPHVAGGIARAPQTSTPRAARPRGAGSANAAALGLPPAERDLGAEQLGGGAASAPFLPAAIGGAKRAYYDAVAEAKKADGAPTPQRAPGVLGMFDGDAR